MQLKHIFKNEQGAVDLASIMTGIVILGITGGVIAATVFAIIPWVQDGTAKRSLQSVGVAQTGYKYGMGQYGNINDLTREKLLEQSYAADPSNDGTIAGNGKLCSRVDSSGGYLASSKSATGKYFNMTSRDKEPVKVKEYQTCFVEDYTAYDMVFTIDTSLPNCTTYTFPAKKWLSGVSVMWGDAKDPILEMTNFPTHTFPEQREYTVKVKGQFSMYGNPEMTNMNCITAIKKWQNTGTVDARYAFAGTTNLKEVAEIPSTVTQIDYMFLNSTFNGDISDWDTSNVTSMSYLFQNATNFNGDISKWNTSKIHNFIAAFNGATSFNQPIDSWDTRAGVNMTNMFRDATSFNQPLNSWNVEKVKNMSAMFRGATSFNQPLNNWNTLQVANTWSMFYGANAFNQDISSWKTALVTDMSYMFYNAESFNKPLDTWDTGNVTSLSNTFRGAMAFNQPLNNWNTAKVTSMSSTFHTATEFNQDLSNWKTSAVLDTSYMFYNTKNFNKNISSWDVSKVTTMAAMFREALAFNQNVSGWNTSSVTSMQNTFYGAKAFKQDLSGWSIAANPISTSFRIGSGMTAAQSPFKV